MAGCSFLHHGRIEGPERGAAGPDMVRKTCLTSLQLYRVNSSLLKTRKDHVRLESHAVKRWEETWTFLVTEYRTVSEVVKSICFSYCVHLIVNTSL